MYIIAHYAFPFCMLALWTTAGLRAISRAVARLRRRKNAYVTRHAARIGSRHITHCVHLSSAPMGRASLLLLLSLVAYVVAGRTYPQSLSSCSGDMIDALSCLFRLSFLLYTHS